MLDDTFPINPPKEEVDRLARDQRLSESLRKQITLSEFSRQNQYATETPPRPRNPETAQYRDDWVDLYQPKSGAAPDPDDHLQSTLHEYTEEAKHILGQHKKVNESADIIEQGQEWQFRTSDEILNHGLIAFDVYFHPFHDLLAEFSEHSVPPELSLQGRLCPPPINLQDVIKEYDYNRGIRLEKFWAEHYRLDDLASRLLAAQKSVRESCSKLWEPAAWTGPARDAAQSHLEEHVKRADALIERIGARKTELVAAESEIKRSCLEQARRLLSYANPSSHSSNSGWGVSSAPTNGSKSDEERRRNEIKLYIAEQEAQRYPGTLGGLTQHQLRTIFNLAVDPNSIPTIKIIELQHILNVDFRLTEGNFRSEPQIDPQVLHPARQNAVLIIRECSDLFNDNCKILVNYCRDIQDEIRKSVMHNMLDASPGFVHPSEEKLVPAIPMPTNSGIPAQQLPLEGRPGTADPGDRPGIGSAPDMPPQPAMPPQQPAARPMGQTNDSAFFPPMEPRWITPEGERLPPTPGGPGMYFGW